MCLSNIIIEFEMNNEEKYILLTSAFDTVLPTYDVTISSDSTITEFSNYRVEGKIPFWVTRLFLYNELKYMEFLKWEDWTD